MEKTTENLNGILYIISLLQRKYPVVFGGDYLEHYSTEKYTYLVLLTDNSSIEIHKTLAQDAETSIGFVTDESLDGIIKTYKKN